MTQQIINIGSAPNDTTGDPIRTAWTKANANFTELYAAIDTPQGRLTLQAATPVMTATQAAQTTLYYTPYVGNTVPIYNGTTMTMMTFAELSVATTDTTKSPAAIGASKVNDWFVWNDSGTLRLGHGPDWASDTARTDALVRVGGIWLNNVSITNACGAQRGTYVGTTRSNASSQLDWIIGGAASGGTAGFFGIWNCYNRKRLVGRSTDNGATYTYSSATVRQARASAGNQVSFVVGLVEDSIDIFYSQQLQLSSVSGSGVYCGIGFDSTSAYSARTFFTSGVTSGGNFMQFSTYFSTTDHSIGYHIAYALEQGDGANGNTLGNTNPVVNFIVNISA